MRSNEETPRAAMRDDERARTLDVERLELRRLEAERALAASRLAMALDRPNGESVARLVALGLSAESAAAFHVLPLLEVGWADGALDSAERELVVAGARRAGVTSHRASRRLLDDWLEARPDPALLRLWHELAEDDRSRRVSSDERWRVVRDAEAVAKASGGIFGVAAISRAERKVLAMIQASLGGSAAPPAR